MIESDWVEIGVLGDIAQSGARRACIGGIPVALFRTSDDEVFALVDRCPHKAGPLSEGIVAGRGVTCPLHNWIIDLTTGKACSPDEGETQTIAVKLIGERIFIAASPLQAAAEACAAGAAA